MKVLDSRVDSDWVEKTASVKVKLAIYKDFVRTSRASPLNQLRSLPYNKSQIITFTFELFYDQSLVTIERAEPSRAEPSRAPSPANKSSSSERWMPFPSSKKQRKNTEFWQKKPIFLWKFGKLSLIFLSLSHFSLGLASMCTVRYWNQKRKTNGKIKNSRLQIGQDRKKLPTKSKRRFYASNGS